MGQSGAGGGMKSRKIINQNTYQNLLLFTLAFSGRFGTHSLRYFFSAVSGISDFPEFTIVGQVDDQQFMYFDSKIMKVVPKTEWMRQSEGADYWDRETQTSIGAHQVYKVNIQTLKARFNQTTGVHTVQVMYGCEFDDQTGETNGFRQDGYDGEDFLFLDLKEMRWITPVMQGIPTIQKWNNYGYEIEAKKHYFSTVCIEWLKKYLEYGKSSLKKTVSPQVSLLQKSSSSSVMCHATGFYPKEVTISWMKNDQDHHEDVEVGEPLPNEDGTFQKSSELRVTPEEWKNNKFICVVEHQGRAIRKILTEKEIRTNQESLCPSSSLLVFLGLWSC
ncbi:H-2 class I histocompatibility antigen, Q9 alpha chain isoform X3 [Carassius gibelio]|uniref:H-2 class I histocompatibility antigen, Q9 alpha chain isoform X3 n=1 Tax=Carassius gibelio TaxID=101364 RepID=UPI002278E540|nr:H-2 class I histocompatibility antigen, Q9 alpha chain isoform X3 [Carassius gibelio]